MKGGKVGGVARMQVRKEFSWCKGLGVDNEVWQENNKGRGVKSKEV